MSRSILYIAFLMGVSVSAHAQVMTCSETGSGDCHFVHYHVQSYNDKTRGTVEFYGTNRFATMDACEAERSRRMSVEKQAVSHVLKLASRARVKESNFGICHCDKTSDPSNRYFLSDDDRFKQMHLQREVTLQLLEEAFDKGLPTDSPIAEGLSTRPTSFVSSLWPNVARIPPDSPDRFLGPEPPQPLSTEITAIQTSQLDTSRYELVEIGFGEEVPLETVTIHETGGRDPASAFVNAEISELQRHLPVILDMEESNRKERVLELIQQRMQLLSNLSRLVQTSGQSSAFARTIETATSDVERKELVGRIFGAVVQSHWSADQPEGLLIEIPDSIIADPVAVLRDSGRRFSREERQLALYAFLLKTGTLTENIEIWLSGIIENSLSNEEEM